MKIEQGKRAGLEAGAAMGANGAFTTGSSQSKPQYDTFVLDNGQTRPFDFSGARGLSPTTFIGNRVIEVLDKLISPTEANPRGHEERELQHFREKEDLKREKERLQQELQQERERNREKERREHGPAYA